jgi:hypothetical protein
MERERERARARERKREVEREGKNELENIQRAMLMLCSSAGGTHSDFCACGRRCRHISAAALKSCSEGANSKLVVEWFWASQGGLSRPGHVSRSEPGPR